MNTSDTSDHTHSHKSYGIAISDLAEDNYKRVRDAIRALAEESRPSGCKKLKGREGWRIRVGDYRVVYDIDDEAQTVLIVHIGHRRDVYRS
ncbi:type II toxin-antitoxin system RelE family toxin [Trichothermofontia sp.]